MVTLAADTHRLTGDLSKEVSENLAGLGEFRGNCGEGTPLPRDDEAISFFRHEGQRSQFMQQLISLLDSLQ